MQTLISTFKLTTLSRNISYLSAFIIGLGLDFNSVVILAYLMVFDIVIGVLRSILIHGGNSFRSRLLTQGIISKLLVLFIPIILVYIGKGARMNFVPIADGMVSILVLSEGYSIFGHIQSIRIGKDVKEFDAISMVLGNVRSVLEKILTNSSKP